MNEEKFQTEDEINPDSRAKLTTGQVWQTT